MTRAYPCFSVSPPYVCSQSRYGWMLVNPNDYFIGRAILEYGEYGEVEAQFLSQLLDRPGLVVEVGANIGTHSIMLAKQLLKEKRRLMVFEPQPFIFQNLAANLALNALQNVIAWPFACGAATGHVYFSPPNYLSGGNFGGVAMNYQEDTHAMRVPCVRLDDMIEEKVGLIKIDVEGFEQEVLQGATRILTQDRPTLYVENDRPEKSSSLIEWLWQHHYQLWWHLPPLFNPDNFYRNARNDYENIVSCNMLALPEESSYQVNGLIKVTDSLWFPLKV